MWGQVSSKMFKIAIDPVVLSTYNLPATPVITPNALLLGLKDIEPPSVLPDPVSVGTTANVDMYIYPAGTPINYISVNGAPVAFLTGPLKKGVVAAPAQAAQAQVAQAAQAPAAQAPAAHVAQPRSWWLGGKRRSKRSRSKRSRSKRSRSKRTRSRR